MNNSMMNKYFDLATQNYFGEVGIILFSLELFKWMNIGQF